MTSDGPMLADDGETAPATERDVLRPEEALRALSSLGAAQPEPRGLAPAGDHLDSRIVEELTSRLPTADLVKIIKNALECGRRNVPFTESDLLRAMTFGSSFAPERQLPRAPRG